MLAGECLSVGIGRPSPQFVRTVPMPPRPCWLEPCRRFGRYACGLAAYLRLPMGCRKPPAPDAAPSTFRTGACGGQDPVPVPHSISTPCRVSSPVWKLLNLLPFLQFSCAFSKAMHPIFAALFADAHGSHRSNPQHSRHAIASSKPSATTAWPPLFRTPD